MSNHSAVASHCSGGEVVARILESFGVSAVFGVISIHNVPILEAFDRRNTLRFVPTRGEQGATNMADGYARLTGSLGVVITSTGPGAGNTAGAMTEALAAGTPLLHLTGQIDSADVDLGRAMNHETADQLSMLAAVSKAAFRVRNSDELARVVTRAITCALTPPTGPVSVEIPIDLQKKPATMPDYVPRLTRMVAPTDQEAVARLVALIAKARRPLIWAGGGARHCGAELQKLLGRGFGLVTSVHGRAVVSEEIEQTLGALHNGDASEKFFRSCDLLIVAGSRLRAVETKLHRLSLPKPLAQIDIDLAAWNRNYASDLFVLGDCRDVLSEVARRLPENWATDPKFGDDIRAAKKAAQQELRKAVGPYGELSDLLRKAMPRDAIFVRDVTISTNTWANRLFPMYNNNGSISALGGGIGQGVQQAIGASVAAGGRKVVVLCGDGGLAVNIGELATMVQEQLDVLIILMNDGGYGVIKNIVNAAYGDRDFYSNLFLPDMLEYAKVMKMQAWRARSLQQFADIIPEAVAAVGPRIVEVDMTAIGPFPEMFAGPRIR
jgi:acetolactate synthase I/II/III large subunit